MKQWLFLGVLSVFLVGCGGKVSNTTYEAARGVCVANEGLSYVHSETVDNTAKVECVNGATFTIEVKEQ